MTTSSQTINEQFKQLTEMQAKSLEPMRIFGGMAAEAMEQLMRKNYAVLGDFVDFSVKQAQLPMNGDSAGEVVAAQVAETTAFTELLSSRAAEYVELANNFNTKARQAAQDAAKTVKAA